MDLRLDTVVDADRRTVWDAVRDKAGPLAFLGGSRVVEEERDKRLVFEWTGLGVTSVVRVELAPAPWGGTIVRIWQGGTGAIWAQGWLRLRWWLTLTESLPRAAGVRRKWGLLAKSAVLLVLGTAMATTMRPVEAPEPVAVVAAVAPAVSDALTEDLHQIAGLAPFVLVPGRALTPSLSPSGARLAVSWQTEGVTHMETFDVGDRARRGLVLQGDHIGRVAWMGEDPYAVVDGQLAGQGALSRLWIHLHGQEATAITAGRHVLATTLDGVWLWSESLGDRRIGASTSDPLEPGALSPDGRRVAIVAGRRLEVRSLVEPSEFTLQGLDPVRPVGTAEGFAWFQSEGDHWNLVLDETVVARRVWVPPMAGPAVDGEGTWLAWTPDDTMGNLIHLRRADGTRHLTVNTDLFGVADVAIANGNTGLKLAFTARSEAHPSRQVYVLGLGL